MATWIRPVEGKITDDFQRHINRPGGSRNPGTDYAVPMETPVKAIADGIVEGTVQTVSGAGGRMIYLKFPDGHNADYLHLQKIMVQKGQEVKQGDIIGLSGASGLGSNNGYGPHLHFAFRFGGTHTMATGNIDFETVVGSAPKTESAPKPKSKPKGKTYKVVKGDTLTKIAKANGTTVANLVELNKLKDKNKISIGQTLKIG
jgi:murein DD-endopeptidase